MQFCRKVLCKPCSARVTSPEEDMEYKMGSCIGISRRQPEAKSLTKRDDKGLLTVSSSSQQSLLSLPDVPVISGVEESRSSAEDQDELEFPHDLLPSLDFSSELNIWESSLGAQTSSAEGKCEQVNPLLAGLQQHHEVSPPRVVLDKRPHDSDPVLTDVQPSPRPSATPHPDVRPLTPPLSVLLDRELQEAFQECEEQMASLSTLSPSGPPGTKPETVHNEWKKTGEVMVKKSTESSSRPPLVVQPGHSNGGHGNKKTGQKAKAVEKPENNSEAVSLTNVDTHTESTESMSQADALSLICGEQPDCGCDFKRQLSPRGKPCPSPPPSSSHSSHDHLSDLGWSPASNQALSQRPLQSENHKHADAPCDINHCLVASPQRMQHATGAVIDKPDIPMTDVRTTVINPASDKRSGAVSSEAGILAYENQSPFSNRQFCVGESSVESALEEALVVVAALPLATPTMPEVIESKREREHDSLKRVSTVVIAESEKAVGEKGLEDIEKCFFPSDGEEKGLPDSLALICSQGKGSLAFSAKEGQAVSEESCSSKMPHNSAEAETKGQRETAVHSADISPAEEGDREKGHHHLEAFVITSPLRILSGPDCQAHRAAGLVGGGEEVGEKGGLAIKHSSFSQPESSAGGVSSSEAEACPLTNVAESQLKSHGWREPIASISGGVFTEQDRLLPPDTSSRMPLTTKHQITAERQASNDQQVQPESSTEETFQAQTPNNINAMSGVGVSLCEGNKGNNRVRFADTVKQEGSYSVNPRSMALSPMDCASLPPLTVHESLYHPVVEASYIFPEFLVLKKPEIPTNATPAKDDLAKVSPSDFPKPQKDVQSDKGEMGIKVNKETINSNFETNTTDSKSEACSKQPLCPTEKNGDLSHAAENAFPEADHHKAELVSANVTKQLEAETRKGALNLCLSAEKETDKLHAESKNSVSTVPPQESPLLSDEGNQHPLISCSVPPADDVTSELLVGQLSADPDPFLQTQPSDLSYQPPIQLDQTPLRGLLTTDPIEATEGSIIPSAVQTKNESAASVVTASDQSVPVIEQCVGNSFVLRPRGPLLSHLELISDCDISLPEQTDNSGAYGDSAKVSGEEDGNKSREITKLSVAKDLEHNDVKVDEPPGAVGVLAKDGSDNVISQSHTEPIGIKPVICEASIKDDLIYVSSDLPTNKACDKIKQEDMKEKMGDQTSVLFAEEKKKPEEATMDNQKETADRSTVQIGERGTALQQGNGPDTEAVEEIRDLQPPHKHKIQKTESLIGDIKEEGEGKSQTSSLSPNRPVGSPEDRLSAEVEFGSEPQTGYEQSLLQTPTATLEHSSDREKAPDQSQSTLELNSFPQQQQRLLGSRHPTEDLSGGCLKGGEQTNSKARQTLAMAPGVREGGHGSVVSLCQSGRGDELTDDDSSGNERGIGLEKGKGEGAVEVDSVYVPSHLASDVNESGKAAQRNALTDTTALSHISETRQGMDENKSPALEVVGSGTDTEVSPEASTVTQSEKPRDQVSKPGDHTAVNPIVAAPHCEGETLVEHVCSSAEAAEVSERQPETNWIQALKEAASHTQSKQETLRAFPSLESPKLEFLTPAEEIAAPPKEDEIPPPAQAVEKTTEIPPLNLEKKPVDLPEPLKKLVDLPEPLKKPVDLPEPLKKPVNLPEPLKKPVDLPEPLKKLVDLPEPLKKPVDLPEPLKKPVDLTEPLKKPVDLPEPLKKPVDLPEPFKKPKPVDLPEPLKKPVDLPALLKKTVELPEPIQGTKVEVPEPIQLTKVELQQEAKKVELSEETRKVELSEETRKVELSEPTKKEEEPPKELPEPQSEPVTSEIAKEPAELEEPIKPIEELPKPTKYEDPEPTKTATEPPKPEKKLISELPAEELDEDPAEILPEEPIKVPTEETTATETVQDPAEEPQDSG
ncbi:Myosin light chain kinase smooth muscle [Dissostichus eleginoides]|uniref:Myosin light chain kinase smooth muscle n=1 Tax=Dissostichus eleginoides TaxID=100907 RepID=A0AAD9FK82_DISEL|nr:Myosin light chain kinase smooth muscle [Dissostichus eleginoides]